MSMTTISDVANRISADLGLTRSAAMEAALNYWTEIRYVDDHLTIDPDRVPLAQEVTDDDADFIVEVTRRQVEVDGSRMSAERDIRY
jgi:hypothetical protein